MPARSRRQLAVLAANLLLLCANLWPLASPAARVEPLVLGLPFALAWIIATVLASFVSLLWLYLREAGEEEGAPP